jgi:anthranilate phosphoribosyltransferase
VLKQLISELAASKALTEQQVGLAVEQLASELVAVEEKADFLTALSRKGETAEEIGAFTRALHERCIRPVFDADFRKREILDVVGAGGDRLGTFNVSTTVALVAAAAGVAVAKHGNRAVTSPTGSADVLEALGIPFDLGPEEAAQALQQHGFAFLFAPKYHPAFRHIGPARKLCAQRGQPTLFNFLGPLLNPARPTALLVGVPRPALCEPLARVLRSLGARRAMVVCGAMPPEAGGEKMYLDEISILGPTTVAAFGPGSEVSSSILDPASFPIQPASLSDLRGGDKNTNARIVREILSGSERGPKRDIVLLNAAGALYVANQAGSLREGWEAAAEVIDSGRALQKLEELSHH